MASHRWTLALAALLLAAPPAARAAVYYVAPAGGDSNPGSSDAPFASIQRAVDAASPGDAILVRDGVYAFSGAQDSMAVTISKAGTASAWITLQAEHRGAAVLDCALLCHSYINLGGGAAYWVIRGFDIRNGRWGGIFSNSGGGQNILVQRNVIHNIGNRPDTSSIGITGIYTDHGASGFQVDGNVFHDIGRTSGQDGRHDHSIYSKGGLSITNNAFYGLLNGWDIQTADGFSGTIANNTFYGPDPIAGTVGQVMLWAGNSNLVIRNNIFYDPTSVGITTYALSVSGSCTVDHNLFFNDSGAIGVADSLPGCSQSANRLDVNPRLADAPNHDFHLSAGSPAIDAGAPVSGLTTDLDGRSRPSGAGYDVGAFEYAASASVPAPTAPPGGPAAAAQDFRAPQRFLSPALADGINDQAIFGPAARQVRVFDAGGTLVFEASRSGTASIVWNGRDSMGRVVASGVYIVRITKDDGGSASQTIAVVR